MQREPEILEHVAFGAALLTQEDAAGRNAALGGADLSMVEQGAGIGDSRIQIALHPVAAGFQHGTRLGLDVPVTGGRKIIAVVAMRRGLVDQAPRGIVGRADGTERALAAGKLIE